MSFVIGYAFQNLVVIKSDGRVVDGNEKYVIDENYNKTRKISNKVICGYTGNRDLCEIILNEFLENTPNVTSRNADSVIRSLNTIAVFAKQTHPSVSCSFLVGGFDDNRIPTLNSFKFENIHDITYNRATKSEIAVTALEPDEFAGQGPGLFAKHYLAGNTFEAAMDLSIVEVANNCFSVNGKIFTQRIRL